MLYTCIVRFDVMDTVALFWNFFCNWTRAWLVALVIRVALGEGHEAQHSHQGRGRVPGVRAGEQGHRRSHQALPGTEPPGTNDHSVFSWTNHAYKQSCVRVQCNCLLFLLLLLLSVKEVLGSYRKILVPVSSDVWIHAWRIKYRRKK